jgi:hypothetical protein
MWKKHILMIWRGWVGSAEVTGTSLIAYVEARAAFDRRFRENAFSSKKYHFM